VLRQLGISNHMSKAVQGLISMGKDERIRKEGSHNCESWGMNAQEGA